jgi:molecular chaperone DnaK (HSP70)
VIIEKGKLMPCIVGQITGTTEDNQTAMDISVYQGENITASRNTLLGQIGIRDLEPRPAGECLIEVTLAIDDKGILTMTASETQNSSNKVTANLNMTTQREFSIASGVKSYESDENAKQFTPELLQMIEGTARSVKIQLLEYHARRLMLAVDDPTRKKLEPAVSKVIDLATPAETLPTVERIAEVRTLLHAAVTSAGVTPTPLWLED